MKRFLLVGVVVALGILVVTTVGGGTGTDQQAVALATEQAPGYEQWVSPVWSPGTTGESALFALQGGVGATALSYYLDRLRTSDASDT